MSVVEPDSWNWPEEPMIEATDNQEIERLEMECRALSLEELIAKVADQQEDMAVSPIADVCCHVKALAGEIEAKDEALTKLIQACMSCKKRNTPEWMTYFAECINDAIKALGSDDIVKWPGSWANEFHLESGGE